MPIKLLKYHFFKKNITPECTVKMSRIFFKKKNHNVVFFPLFFLTIFFQFIFYKIIIIS
jgi:hypothetical protein